MYSNGGEHNTISAGASVEPNVETTAPEWAVDIVDQYASILFLERTLKTDHTLNNTIQRTNRLSYEKGGHMKNTVYFYWKP
jgi:hypothetical protein